MPPNFANSRPEFSLLTLSAVAAPSTALFSLSALSLSLRKEKRVSQPFFLLSLALFLHAGASALASSKHWNGCSRTSVAAAER